jgi:hypothetical protein
MDDSWLNDIVVVNESRDETVPGDVQVFRSAGEACRYLEHWWVEDGEGYAFTAAGERLTLGVDESNRVIVIELAPAVEGPAIVNRWLRAYADGTLEARRAKAGKGGAILSTSEELGQLPTSIEGLIAYVGFSR